MTSATKPVTSAPDTTGWVAEWAGDPTPCMDACADALPTFSLDIVEIIVDLLRKPDVFGLDELVTAFGKDKLMRMARGAVHELPMPAQIDVILQTDLSVFLRPEVCAGLATQPTAFGTKRKVTDISSVYFKPQNISACKTFKMGEKCRFQFTGDQELLGYTNSCDTVAKWIIFPNESCSPGYLIPVTDITKHPQDPFIADAFFCIFTKYACTQEWITDECGFKIDLSPTPTGSAAEPWSQFFTAARVASASERVRNAASHIEDTILRVADIPVSTISAWCNAASAGDRIPVLLMLKEPGLILQNMQIVRRTFDLIDIRPTWKF